MDGTARSMSHQYDAGGNTVLLYGDAGYTAGFTYGAASEMIAYQGVFLIGYDTAGRRAGIDMAPGMTSWTSWRYDPVGRLQTQAHDLAGTSADQSTTFGYNPANQITTEVRTNEAYAFTRAANVARTYAVNGLNQYTGAGPAGAQTPFGYDLNGNLTDTPAGDGGGTHYTYDAENRLVQAATTATTGTNTVNLAYDPDGRLWQVSAPTGTTRYVYDGDRRILEYDGAGIELRGYHWGPGTDEPFIWYELTGGPVVRFLHADHQGSIVAVADASGNPLAVNAYDPWGIPNATNQGRFGYTGQAWLPELGMWYYKARIYSPTLGRFLQTDPIGYKDQANLYAYVGNDPVNNSDPSGEDNCDVHQADGSIRHLANCVGDVNASPATQQEQQAADNAVVVTGQRFKNSKKAPRSSPAGIAQMEGEKGGWKSVGKDLYYVPLSHQCEDGDTTVGVFAPNAFDDAEMGGHPHGGGRLFRRWS